MVKTGIRLITGVLSPCKCGAEVKLVTAVLSCTVTISCVQILMFKCQQTETEAVQYLKAGWISVLIIHSMCCRTRSTDTLCNVLIFICD